VFRLHFAVLFLGPFIWSHSVQAQLQTSADWSMLPDPEAAQFEDPYRDLSQPQFESLMALARLQITLSGETAEGERAVLQERASEISKGLQAHGLDPEWILAQREAVAERRQRAALSTNPSLDGESIEITGYLLVAPDMEDGAMVAYLLPDRGVCMHLPPPVPNQLIRLDIDDLPEPLGPCINAAVRGRLSANENAATVSVFDDTAHLWSSWRLDVSEAITAGSLPPDDNKD
jgi:hypothetical protein